MTQQQYLEARQQALAYFEKAGIVLTQEEVEHFEVADFGLGDWRNVGLNLVTYVNTQRCCAKEMVLLGKEETFRCRWGEVYLYVAGEPASPIRAQVPETGKDSYTVFHEIVLKPGQQYTLTPNTPHWFQGGPEGAVVSEFSTTSYDEYDVFNDPAIRRIPEIG